MSVLYPTFMQIRSIVYTSTRFKWGLQICFLLIGTKDLIRTKDCRYSLEAHRRGGSSVYPQSIFEQKNGPPFFWLNTENVYFLQPK